MKRSIKKWLLLVCVSILVFSLTACSLSSLPVIGGFFEDDDSSTAAPPSRPSTNGSAGGQFTAVNDGEDIYYVRIATAGSSDFGDDLLGSEVLNQGETLDLALSGSDEFYDIQVTFSGSLNIIFENVPIAADNMLVFNATPTGGSLELFDDSDNSIGMFAAFVPEGNDVGPDENTSSGDTVTLVNEGSASLWYAYFAPAGTEDWSNDLFGSSTLGQGSEIQLELIADVRTYDIRLEYSGGEAFTFHSLVLDPNETLVFSEANGGTIEHYLASGSHYDTVIASSGGSVGTSSGVASNQVAITNDFSDVSLYIINFNSSAESTWGDDILGSSTVASGESFLYNHGGAGSYDMRVQLSDGTVFEFYGIAVQGGDNLVVSINSSGNFVLLHVIGDSVIAEYDASNVEYS